MPPHTIWVLICPDTGVYSSIWRHDLVQTRVKMASKTVRIDRISTLNLETGYCCGRDRH